MQQISAMKDLQFQLKRHSCTQDIKLSKLPNRIEIASGIQSENFFSNGHSNDFAYLIILSRNHVIAAKIYVLQYFFRSQFLENEHWYVSLFVQQKKPPDLKRITLAKNETGNGDKRPLE